MADTTKKKAEEDEGVYSVSGSGSYWDTHGGKPTATTTKTASSSSSSSSKPAVKASPDTSRNTSLAGQTVLSGGYYVTRDADGYYTSAASAKNQGTAGVVQNRLQNGTLTAGDETTRQIASGNQNAYTGPNDAYTLAKAYADSGNGTVPAEYLASLSPQQRTAIEAASQRRKEQQAAQTAQSGQAWDPNADYHALAMDAASRGDWASFYRYLDLRQAKIDAQGGNDRGTTNADIIAAAMARYGGGTGNTGAGAASQTTASPSGTPTQTPTTQTPTQGTGAAASQLSNLRDLANNVLQTAQIQHIDISPLRDQLEQIRDLAAQQANAQIDYATQTGIRDLQRTEEDAQEQFNTQQNQIDIDERRALDNQALRNAAAYGGRSGVGEAQYNSIMNTAATNRATVNSARTKLSTDISRQIADLRAQGEYQKADALLQVTQSYLQNLMSLEQWGLSTNLSVDQFNAQLAQWGAEYFAQIAQMEISVDQFERNWQLELGRFNWQKDVDARNFAYQQGRDAVSDQQWQLSYDANRDDALWNRQRTAERDSVSDQQWQLSYDADRADTAWNQARTTQRDAVSDQQWQASMDRNIFESDRTFQANREDTAFSQSLQLQNLQNSLQNQRFSQQSTLRNQILTAAQNGIVLSDEEIRAAGLDPAQIKTFAATSWAANTNYGMISSDYVPTSRTYASPTAASSSVTGAAASYVGYKESGTNGTIFNDFYRQWTGQDMTGQPWCVMFVDKTFSDAGLAELLPTKTASTTSFADAAKTKGQWVTSGYQPGDVIIFDYNTGDDKYDHMGIVTSVNSDGTITTIEGNVSDQVKSVAFNPTGRNGRRNVAGAWRPNYAQFGTTAEAVTGDTAGATGDLTSLFTAAAQSGAPNIYLANNYKNYGLSSSSGLSSDYKDWAEDPYNMITNGPKGGEISFVYRPDEWMSADVAPIEINGKEFHSIDTAVSYLEQLVMTDSQAASLIQRMMAADTRFYSAIQQKIYGATEGAYGNF